MSKCSGNCGSCSDKIDKIGTNEAPIRRYTGKDNNDDLFEMVNPRPKKKIKKFSLDDECPHYPFGKMKRASCNICISMWVSAHTDEETEEKIEQLQVNGKAVAARRMQLSLQDRKSKR